MTTDPGQPNGGWQIEPVPPKQLSTQAKVLWAIAIVLFVIVAALSIGYQVFKDDHVEVAPEDRSTVLVDRLEDQGFWTTDSKREIEQQALASCRQLDDGYSKSGLARIASQGNADLSYQGAQELIAAVVDIYCPQHAK